MRLAMGALLLLGTGCFADEAPLRFAIADGWAMPMVQIDRDRPTQGILPDIMTSLATQVGMPAQFHILARARLDSAMEHGEIDLRCYVSPDWVKDKGGDYLWSVPLFFQRDVLVGSASAPARITPRALTQQSIGTVLSYSYPTLQPLFDSGHLRRDDARSQDQVLAKLLAGRYRYAVSNQWALDWFNQRHSADRQLHEVAVLQEQRLSCYVRNDPKIPAQRILRTLLNMKMSGEIDAIIQLYTGRSEGSQADVASP
ncbi:MULTISPECIES: substrate-binding periplasmic protein [Pseudomonas]|jgi:polar amino acid transport system substrate-binding protein|uniref:Amino acid ABC transporter substrate-binding protein n=1 Tax=Pseudomonas frederiksbergensis TaxID=104087 RepID=A0A0B1Z9F3_9PSED|nr:MULTISPECIES: transporter substrate-binding domain-containing protein [Pseudomonas]KHK65983.1 amino acid ABC transporter substrate-binding protein [Pseudomonas frederiksbergensis]KJH87000.1 amino acid ABC transporter substrate-binding protein [Pseudomonas fluorescens]WRV66691.1 transporter substrate-binding domain-containing protein [Pseudomonas frederiksbergensis]